MEDEDREPWMLSLDTEDESLLQANVGVSEVLLGRDIVDIILCSERWCFQGMLLRIKRISSSRQDSYLFANILTDWMYDTYSW